MFSGGDYGEVARWLANFVTSHAKRESPRVEAMVEAEGERENRSYGVRLRLGTRVLPPPGTPPLELDFADVSQHRGDLAWCDALARRVREQARRLVAEEREERRSA
jgi:hypothetical protein